MNPDRISIFVALALLTGIFLPVQTRAGEEEEDLEMDLFFAPAETVTSASRHAQPLDQSPSAVTVLTREDIETSGARIVPEVLRQVPGVDIYLVKPSWHVVGVRGTSHINSDTSLFLVDGRDVTMELLGLPVWAVQHFSLDEVERIEVIRGPGSALYGANAFSGVVHVITMPAGTGPTFQTSLRGGEHGNLEWGGRWSDNIGPLALAASVSLRKHDLFTSRDQNSTDHIKATLKGRIDLGEQSLLKLETGVYRTGGIFVVDPGEGIVDMARDIYAQVFFQHENLEVRAVYSRFDFEGDFGLELYYPLLDAELAAVPWTIASTDTLSIGLQYTLEFFHNRLTMGAEYVFNHFYANVFLDTPPYEHRYGIFVQDEFSLGELLSEMTSKDIDPLFLTAGLRFDDNTRTRWELSPRAALVWFPAEEHSLRLGYSHAFLRPTFFESSLNVRLDDINDLGIDNLDLSNPDLENETIESAEVGYTANLLSGRLIVRLAFAYNWYRNTIRFVVDPDRIEYDSLGLPNLDGPGFDFENLPDGKNGFNTELEIEGRPTERSRLFAHGSYRRIVDEATDEVDPSEPTWRFGLGADLRGTLGWTLSARAYYTHSFDLETRDPRGVLVPAKNLYIPPSWMLNARFSWVLTKAPGKITAGVEAFNLLNFRYRQFSGISRTNANDFNAEIFGRRVVLFLSGEI